MDDTAQYLDPNVRSDGLPMMSISSATREVVLPRAIEHQSTLRSWLSELNSQYMGEEIMLDSQEIEEEIMRQITEDGLLDNIDLNNIDVAQEDEISERIAQAYRKRQEQKRKEWREQRDRLTREGQISLVSRPGFLEVANQGSRTRRTRSSSQDSLQALGSISETSSPPQSATFSLGTEESSHATSELQNAVAVAVDRPALRAWDYNNDFLILKRNIKREEDTDSLVSLEDDIGSQAESSSGSDQYRQAAIETIALQLTSQTDLLRLYQESSRSLGEEKFVRNHRRLLKYLFVILQHGGQKPSEEAAIKFIRSRRRRNDICRAIRRLVSDPKGTSREMVALMEQKDDKRMILGRFLMEKDGHEEPFMTDPDSITDTLDSNDDDDKGSSSDEESATSDHEEQSEAALQTLKAAAEFLTTGENFSKYVDRVSRFVNHESQPIEYMPADSASSQEAHQPQEEALSGDQKNLYIGSSQASSMAVPQISPDRVAHVLSSPFRRWFLKMKRLARPKVKQDHRRIEWICVSLRDTVSYQNYVTADT